MKSFLNNLKICNTKIFKKHTKQKLCPKINPELKQTLCTKENTGWESSPILQAKLIPPIIIKMDLMFYVSIKNLQMILNKT